MKILVLVLLLLTCCTKAQPELRETKEVQTSIPYSDEELIKNANDQIERSILCGFNHSTVGYRSVVFIKE